MATRKRRALPSPPNYWDIQLQAINALAAGGLEFNLNQRLEPFKLLRLVDRLVLREEMSQQHANWIKSSLETLVIMRRLGLEPPHEHGIYIVN